MNELTEFEFVFVDTPEDNGVWVRDPLEGKEKELMIQIGQIHQ